MEDIAVEYLPSSFDLGNNKEKSELCSYIISDNERDACDSHANMVHLLKTILESGILLTVISTVWEDT